ncbi:hypothetical protein [Bradyrhizobium sp. 23]|uniref:hypothetical protein n=1 Tax=Bradyrhizobium sp. 23 TaxID=2782667 RepID=UPI001FF77107|nr:hypothetical protein [Bradyrhizobium sp. 23]MCK1317349.1 hypothetical protein [Bradyrhizobium sp. 23]
MQVTQVGFEVAAGMRLRIATLQLERGDVRGAAAEVHAALLVARELGSHKPEAGCRELQGRIETGQTGRAA